MPHLCNNDCLYILGIISKYDEREETRKFNYIL